MVSFTRRLTIIFSITKIKSLTADKYIALKKELLTILKKSKNLLDTNIEVGLYHFYKGNIYDAKLRFWLISIFRSNSPIPWYNIGRCYFAIGNVNKANHYLTKALKLDSNHQEASYYIKKMTDSTLIRELPKDLIKQYFDYTGEYFVEHWLIAKQYRGHELLLTAVTEIFNNKYVSKANILDLGCGTGICGHFLKTNNIGNHIKGVDISNRMLNIARGCFVAGKAAYNELIHMEIRDFLQQEKNQLYSIIAFIEVLHYLRDFQLELELAKKVMSAEGAIICLLRRDESNDVSFIKQGDYFRHSENYIRNVAEKVNMQIRYISYCKIYGSQVEGILFALQNHTTHSIED